MSDQGDPLARIADALERAFITRSVCPISRHLSSAREFLITFSLSRLQQMQHHIKGAAFVGPGRSTPLFSAFFRCTDCRGEKDCTTQKRLDF